MAVIPDPPPRYRFADLVLDTGQRGVWRGSEPIELGKLSFDLLRVLVEAAPNAVANDDLTNRVWGPRRIVTPENLSRRLLLLRESLGDDSSNPRYIAGIRAFGYRLIPEVERLSADGEARQPRAPIEQPAAPIDHPTARRAPFVLAGGVAASLLLLVALAWWVVDSTLGVDKSADRKSIAVLPFADVSASQDQAWLGDGIAEDLTSILTTIPQFRVTARGSAFALRDRDLPALEIGQTLNARYLLEGSIRRDGDRLRIGAWLVDSATNTQVWSATYPRAIGEVFEVQQEIASAVAVALGIRLHGPLAPTDTTTPEVYALVLQGERIVRDGNVQSLPYARELLERAVDMDRDYLPARIALAYAYGDLPLSGTIDQATAQALILRTLDDAAAIWPERADLNAARGFFAANRGELEAAAGYFKRALAVEPENITVWSAVVPFAIALNREELAVTVGEYVLRLDTLCAVCRFHLLRAYSLTGRPVEAEALYQSSDKLNLATFGGFQYLRGNALLQGGDAEGALAAYGAMDAGGDFALEAGKLTGMTMALHALGRQAESEATFQQLRRLVGTDGWINVSAVHAYRGELDSAFGELNRVAVLRRELFDAPPLAALRGHPGWPELAAKAGIWPDDPRARIEFDVALPR